MPLFKGIVKRYVADVLYYSGFLSLALRLRLYRRGIVLTYHRVLSRESEGTHNSAPGIVIRDDTFDTNLAVIKSIFRPLSQDELQVCIENNTPLPSRSCLITFDDGWLDNYEVAGPLFRKHGITASIFLATDYISSKQTFWQEEMLALMNRALVTSGEAALESNFGVFMDSAQTARQVFRQYISDLKSKPQSTIDATLAVARSLAGDSETSTRGDRFMTWSHVNELQTQGVAFGSHSKSHRILTNLTSTETRDELIESKIILEKRLGHSVSSLAYPNGDYDSKVEALARDAGYSLAFTTQPGTISHKTNPLKIPRVNIHEGIASNKALFLCRVLGFF